MTFRIRIAVFVAALVGGLIARPPAAPAGGGPENVAVVVNSDSWASMAVANEYIHLRKIPARNVVSLRLGDLPNFETVDVETFRTRILKPVLAAVQRRGLTGQIDCVTYSSDIPYAVTVRKDIGERKLPKIITPLASINGLTFLYQLVLAKKGHYLSLRSNFYYRRPRRAGAETMRLTPQQAAQLAAAVKLLGGGKCAEAEGPIRKLLQAHPKSPTMRLQLARCLAGQDRADKAMAELKRAVALGFGNRAAAEADKHLKRLVRRDDFRELMSSIETVDAAKIDVGPSVAFANRHRWAPGGVRVRRGMGVRYLLSTMLAVTSGRGNSVSEAVAALRRAASADGKTPKGTIYLMTNRDVRSRTRKWAFTSAVDELKKLAVAAEIVEGTLPKKRPDVMGLLAGSAAFNFSAAGNTILPGAICEHLTSTGGVMHQSGGQTCISEFIRHGAAGTCGTVTEPFAVQAKFPTAFLHVHYARGCTLAEAFYQSVAGPYQLLIIGDPLCRPWAKVPQVTAAGIRAGQTRKGKVTITPQAKTPGGPAIERFELILDGKRVAACRSGGTIAVNTVGVSDGYHELRIIAVAADAIQTQGRVILPVTLDNRGRKLTFSCSKRTCRLDEDIPFEAALGGAERIEIRCHDRVLLSAQGAKAAGRIPARDLGLGPVRLQAIGLIRTDRGKDKPPLGEWVRARPIDLTVQPPASLGPTPVLNRKALAPGLRLTSAGLKPVILKDLRNTRTLINNKVKDATPFVLDGYFDVPADGVYQFQVKLDGTIKIEVDTKPLSIPDRPGWKFIPVALAKGTHRFRMTGHPKGKPHLDLRFGARGARSPNHRTFQHATTAKP